jgi:hypothetical protein
MPIDVTFPNFKRYTKKHKVYAKVFTVCYSLL